MTIESTLNPIRQWVETYTEMIVVIEPNNAPQPKRPYCTLYIPDIITVGQDYIDTGSTKTFLRGVRDVVTEINCYGDGKTNPMDTLNNLRATLYNDEIIGWFASNGMVQLDIDDKVSDTTYQSREESHWIPRATTRITFRMKTEVELPLFIINKTTVDISLKSGITGDINSTIEI